MKNVKTFEDFVNESADNITEATITDTQMEMAGKKLIDKITIGAKFYGNLKSSMKHTSKDVVLTVTGYGNRANAYKEFEVETAEGEKLYLRVTVMYGTSYKVMSSPHGNWENADGLVLDKIEI